MRKYLILTTLALCLTACSTTRTGAYAAASNGGAAAGIKQSWSW